MTLRLDSPQHLHLVGIGGAGMSGLARILVQRGHVVAGSDLRESRRTDELVAMGATITIGHAAGAVGPADAVVVSSAVGPDNPEVVAARERGIQVVRRADLLATLMDQERRILVAGTHGKTTTTSMTVVALQATGMDPSFSIGAQLNEAGTNAHAGTDGVFVAEADESDRSLLAYTPDIAVVTNVELDHPDAYADLAAVEAVFTEFLANRRDNGVAVLCVDDPGASQLAAGAGGVVVTYGEAADADYRLVVTGSREGRVMLEGREVAALTLPMHGLHNLLNATAALAICDSLGRNLDQAVSGLTTFLGVVRRFQVLGTVAGVTIVDDYAHHPTELRATLSAARAGTDKRVIVVVQPHRYSRTRQLGPELGRAAAAADMVYVTDVYGAGETPVPGVSGRLVAEAALSAGARVAYEPHFEALVARLVTDARAGDVVVVTGAGDVSQVGLSLVHALTGADGDR